MNRRNRIRNNKGFTLVELLAVMVILSLLASVVGVGIWNRISGAQRTTAKTQIKSMANALDTFRFDIGRYPTTQEGLQSLVTNPGLDNWDGPYIREPNIPKDPWQNPYQYQSPGAHGEYDLFSYGKDGTPGGDGDNADVNNWE